MRGWNTVLAATALAALLSTGAFAQETTAPTTEPAATETAAPTLETPPTDAATTEAPAAETAAPTTEAAAAEAPGRIIFFRPGRLAGAVYTYHIVEVAEDGDSTRDSPQIGSLPNGQYFEYAAPPGIHNYNIRGPMAVNLDEDRIRLEVESGETYYIEQTVRMGLITGGFRLVPSTQAEFERRRLRQWTPREE
ncbi:MAG: hypothetical protein NT015_13365 [Alphaproteobacteria bacterium]|nr:hypothetical protein [Alphaproteobacteria bacterium]